MSDIITTDVWEWQQYHDANYQIQHGENPQFIKDVIRLSNELGFIVEAGLADRPYMSNPGGWWKIGVCRPTRDGRKLCAITAIATARVEDARAGAAEIVASLVEKWLMEIE